MKDEPGHVLFTSHTVNRLVKLQWGFGLRCHKR
jgi:hypothetical protein